MAKDTWSLDGEGLTLTPDTPCSELFDLPPYTSSEDKKGHEIFLGARFPKSFARRVAQLRESSGEHYSVGADVVRDAINIGLSVIEGRLKQPGWGIERLLANQRAKIFEHARVYKAIEDTVNNLADLCSSHDEETARDDLASLVAYINESSLRDKYRAALQQKLSERRLTSLLGEQL